MLHNNKPDSHLHCFKASSIDENKVSYVHEC